MPKMFFGGLNLFWNKNQTYFGSKKFSKNFFKKNSTKKINLKHNKGRNKWNKCLHFFFVEKLI